jgi:hypothetical protein
MRVASAWGRSRFPKTGKPKNKSKESGIFFEADLRSFSDHRPPAFHHDFTIKKPRSAPRFSQKPLQKTRNSTTPEKKKNSAAVLGDDQVPDIISDSQPRSLFGHNS